jgi:hypothetical protein
MDDDENEFKEEDVWDTDARREWPEDSSNSVLFTIVTMLLLLLLLLLRRTKHSAAAPLANSRNLQAC